MGEIDSATGILLGRIGQQESHDALESAAIGFATGRRAGSAAPPPSAAAAAHAMEPVLVALALHARRLAVMEAPPLEGPRNMPPDADTLVSEAEAGLVALRRAGGVVSVDAARRGLGAIRGLAAPPPAGFAADAYVANRQEWVADAAAYLIAVLGTDTGRGLQGALEVHARAQLRAEDALLAAVRADRAVSVLDRYALFHRVAGAQSELPGQLQTLEHMTQAFRVMPEAHAALGRPDAAEGSGFQAFLAAADTLRAEAASPAPR